MAQSPAPAYDVVVIKPNKSVNGSWDIDTDNFIYSAKNISMRSLLRDTYNVRPELISGIPESIDGERWDLEAKIVEADLKAVKQLTRDQRRSLMLPVLVDRFQLKAHFEEKILPVYELVVVPGGPKFKAAVPHAGSDGTHINNNREMTATGVLMESLADTLSGQVHRTVIDKTGLAGQFDLALKWAPEDSAAEGQSDAPSIFTALQEQLGLKLVAAKGPVKTLVVDHVAMPTAN